MTLDKEELLEKLSFKKADCDCCYMLVDEVTFNEVLDSYVLVDKEKWERIEALIPGATIAFDLANAMYNE